MKTLKTPKSRFDKLPEYSFAPRFVVVGDGLNMHYIDNEAGDPPIIMLHGEPSWSFLYRKMIKVFQSHGWRTIAPDLIGFGKSDKPTSKGDYSYSNHEKWLEAWFRKIDVHDAFLYVQDWGGLLGLRLAAKHKDRFRGLIISNTFLPSGQEKANKAFTEWKDFSQNVPLFPVGKIIDMGTVNPLPPEVINAYDAPFPDESFKTGARQFPTLVPFGYDHPECIENREVWKKLENWEKPVLTLFSDSDPIMNGLDRIFQEQIPGCKGQPHNIIKGAGHFLQEDKGEEIADKIINWVSSS